MILRYADLSVYPQYFRWQFPDKQENFDVIDYIKQAMWVHDCDDCGSNVDFYVVVTDTETKYYRIQHEWGWTNWTDLDERDLYNDFEIAEVKRDELDEYAIKNLRFVV